MDVLCVRHAAQGGVAPLHALQEEDKDARLGVLRASFRGGEGDLPGSSPGEVAVAAGQLIDDMEEREVVADRWGACRARPDTLEYQDARLLLC